ncbi:MAG: 2,3-cyclic 3-phosphodiesterase [Actinomycetota bacterium]|nr:2,3-cyclic 3-phosphodiesterase [Actinomycetota bacterium]
MRLFVALRPPPEVLEHADAAVAQVRAREPGPRWIPAERWHLTLAFYGEIADDSVDGVAAMVARRLPRLRDRAPVDLAFAGSGSFARRALWLGVTGDLPRLRSLATAVNTDRRPYRPHLTVARLRAGGDPGAAVAMLAAYDGPQWRATTVHLVQSHLGPKPRYDDVASWPLGTETPD